MASPSDPHVNRELSGLCVGVAVAFTGFTMSAPLVPLQALSLGASPGLIGVLVSVTSVGSLLAAIPGGMLVQRLGTRRPIVASVLLMATSGLLLTLFPSLATFFPALTLFEVGRIVVMVGAQGHVANLGGGRDAGLDFGWYGSAAAIGQMLGPYAAGLAIDHLGFAPAWGIIVATMAAAALAFGRLIGPGRFGDSGRTRARYDRARLQSLLDIPGLVAILASFIVIFATGTRTTFFPVYGQGLGFSASAIGVLMSLRALVSMSARLLMRRFLRLCGGRFPALLISMTALAVGIGLTPLCRDLPTLALNSILVGIGTGIALPLSMAAVADGVAPEDRGVAMGLRLSGNRLARLINPLFFGLLIQGFGIATAFWAGGVVLLMVIVPIFLWWRQGRLGAAGESAGGPGPSPPEPAP